MLQTDNCIHLYTDGACAGNPGIGGYAYILKFKDKIKKKSGGFALTTNNRMELKAVIEGLRQIKKNIPIIIYSDSKYIIDAFNKNWIYNWQKKNWIVKQGKLRANFDLWQELLDLTEKFTDIQWIWVKGHSDNEFNNECDKLAVAETKKNNQPQDINYIKGENTSNYELF